MGDPKKKHKRYTTPKRPYDSDALMEELRLIGAYGLRNKKELWRHRTELSALRRRARELLSLEPVERAEMEGAFIAKLHRMGLVGEGARGEDVLTLTIEELLERRLQTVVYRKGLAKSLFQARQLITHGHISVGGRKLRAPSYAVTYGDEETLGYAGSSPLSAREHPLRREMAVEETAGGRRVE